MIQAKFPPGEYNMFCVFGKGITIDDISLQSYCSLATIEIESNLSFVGIGQDNCFRQEYSHFQLKGTVTTDKLLFEKTYLKSMPGCVPRHSILYELKNIGGGFYGSYSLGVLNGQIAYELYIKETPKDERLTEAEFIKAYVENNKGYAVCVVYPTAFSIH